MKPSRSQPRRSTRYDKADMLSLQPRPACRQQASRSQRMRSSYQDFSSPGLMMREGAAEARSLVLEVIPEMGYSSSTVRTVAACANIRLQTLEGSRSTVHNHQLKTRRSPDTNHSEQNKYCIEKSCLLPSRKTKLQCYRNGVAPSPSARLLHRMQADVRSL